MILPQEVKELAKINKHVPTCDLQDIKQVEKVAARNCLGKSFYAALLADLKDYSEIPAWTGASVTADTVRLYKGIYYKAKTTTTAEPTVKTDWEEAPKFETDCYNDLWCEGGLGRYLALLVVQNSIPIMATAVTAQGVSKRDGEGHRAAEEAEVLRLQNWIASNVASALDNLDEYLKDNSANACFSTYKGNTQSSSCTGGCLPECTTVFNEDGSITTFEPELYNSETNCNCPACTENAKMATNRYVIA